MTQRQRLKLTKLGIIMIAWLCIAVLITFYDYFLLTSGLSAGLVTEFSIINNLMFNLVAALLGALMGGGFLVYYVNEKYRDKPYWFTVTAVVLSFIVVVSIITIALALIAAPLQTGKSLFDPETKEAFTAFLTNKLHAKNIIIWSPVVALTQIMLQFNTKFGEGNMWNMISGKYQTPKTEQRIFMFVDLNASTTIAEKLGDERYHQLLKTF
ncbi:MAG: hypothetical protein JNM19_02365, partial [Chitinophagaceae bacterium]|nr:hypothetical protein [Chitinophagaceae bacterium]